MAKGMSEEHKAKMAFGRLLTNEAKELKVKDEVTVEAFNMLVTEMVLLRATLESAVKIIYSEKEVSEWVESIMNDIVGSPANEEIQEPIIDHTMDLGDVESVQAERKPSWPAVKQLWWRIPKKTIDENAIGNINYYTIAKKVATKLGKTFQWEKSSSGKVVRYVERETYEARLSDLRKQGIDCKVNWPFKEEIPVSRENDVLINWYNSGYLVLSSNKIEKLWISH